MNIHTRIILTASEVCPKCGQLCYCTLSGTPNEFKNIKWNFFCSKDGHWEIPLEINLEDVVSR